MVSVDDKIKEIEKMCKGMWSFEIDHMFKYIYPFTTENISGYLPYFDLEDKSLLTVGSSGDQAINAILMGSKDITVIDLCMFAKEYFNLKRAAIASLTREEFFKFFCYYHYNDKKSNHYAFNKKSYLKLREALGSYDNESLYFWDYLFYNYRSIKIRKRLFNYDESRRSCIIHYNEYLKSDITYDELKNKIDRAKVDFTVDNVSSASFDKKFDNIFLSNINSYCSASQLKTMYENMVKYLNDDGRMLAAYLYLTDVSNLEDGIKEDQIDNFNLLLGTLPSTGVDMYSFPGVGGVRLNDELIKDSVLTYKKVKKI